MAFNPEQQNWKWFQDDAAEPASALANENTAPSVPVNVGIIRLRLTIAETGGFAGSVSYPILEYSLDDTNFILSGETGSVWAYANGQASGGDVTTTFKTSDATTHGKYHENWYSAAESFEANAIQELDFSISLAAAPIAPGTYYFRLRDYFGNIVPLKSGASHPSLILTVPIGINASKLTSYSVVTPPIANILVSKTVSYAVVINIQTGINISKAVIYSIVEESTSHDVNDGTSSLGIIFGGEVVEIGVAVNDQNDGISSQGLIFGGIELSTITNDSIDGLSSRGIVIGGMVSEKWQNISGDWLVAVKGGTFRISGIIYTLPNTMYYEGLGDISIIIPLSAPPTSPNIYRYDLLTIDVDSGITVTEGTAAAIPIMPDIPPLGGIILSYVLRYYNQGKIIQSDIGKLYSTPQLSKIDCTVADSELEWTDFSTTITLNIKDQYGMPYAGGVIINASFVSGNGTLTPLVQSGKSASFTFYYYRGQVAGDKSPIIQFMTDTGAIITTYIILLDALGDPMF